MQNETAQFSTSGHISSGNHQAGGPEATCKYYQCSRCDLLLKSKVYLFDHLTKVHGFDVDLALKSAGLKHAESNSSGRPRESFKACNGNNLKDYLSYCSKNPERPGPKGGADEHDGGAGADEEPAGEPPQQKAPPSSLKDLKSHKRATQNITKFLVASSRAAGKWPDESSSSSSDGSQETLLLQETPSSSSPNNSGVFQLTAKPAADPAKLRPHSSSPNDPLSLAKTGKANAQEKSHEEVQNGKRTREDGVIICPAKKSKSDEGASTEKENASQHPSTGSFGEGDAPAGVFFCKHCDYSDGEVGSMARHYRSDHPYIRHSSAYIQDPGSTSATFRCLECPVEFFSRGLLKRHYVKHHPEAPDVFALKSSELRLGFRCFQCAFTTMVVEALKEHYSDKHQMGKTGNSLLFCRYSVSPQESSPQGNCEQSEESLEENDGSCTTLPQQPESKAPDGAVYECNACAFSHKSVVVMHVHYQRSHPEEVMTMDKIKQLARLPSLGTPQATPEKSTSSAAATRSSGDSPRGTEDTAAPSPPPDTGVSSDSAQNHLQSLEDEDVNKTKKSSAKSNTDKTPGEDSPDDPSHPIYYCQFCSYKSTHLRSVSGHHHAKHFMHMKMNDDQIVEYSAAVSQKRTARKASKCSSSSPPETRKPVKRRHEAEGAADAPRTDDNPYADPEALFYCSKCNYANTNALGVLNHQARLHSGPYSTYKCIMEHTTHTREQIRKSKSQPDDSPFSRCLPLPLMNEGDRRKFFCHFCNYRHSNIAHVMTHYSKVHQGYRVRPAEIELYTSVLLKRTAETPGVSQAVDEEVMKEKAKGLPQTFSASSHKRSLQCATCMYSTPYVYLLKRHLLKAHRKDRTITEVLNESFRRGALQRGFHCEFCLYTSEDAALLLKHYKKRHPKRKLSLEYATTYLQVGHQTPPEEKKRRAGATDDVESRGDGADGSPSTPRRADAYPCSECSFKGDSIDGITRHFRVAHPWTKEDSQGVDQQFDSYQVPLDFEKLTDEAAASQDTFKCPYCPAVMNTQRGLNTHCGMKHQEFVTKNVQLPKKVSDKARVHVFKCPYCSYVNTLYQGAMTHCQMKHPELTLRADSLHVDTSQVQIREDKAKDASGSWKFSGHLCAACSQICSTADELSRHREDEHGHAKAEADQSTTRGASRSDVPRVEKLKISKASLLNTKQYPKLRCQQCPFKCSTNAGLSQHMYAHHTKYAASKNCVYKCVLCSKTYNWKKHLACHYIMKHGRDSYVKYYLPLYKQGPLKARLFKPPSDSASDPGTAGEEQTLLVFRCPRCPYSNTSHHGTLTHCQMKHPVVVARADELQTCQVLSTNMVRCSSGKGANQRGYMCDECPQIHGSLKKLFNHCKTAHHGQGGVEEEAGSSATEAVDIKEEAFDRAIEAGQPDGPEACLSAYQRSLSVPGNSKLYKCHMCSYSGMHRRYLQSHYMKSHKLEPQSVLKLLQRYNKLKPRKVLWLPEKEERQEEEGEESGKHTCKRCPDLTFDLPEQLLDHYQTVHGLHRKLDFIVLSTGERQKTTGLYKCCHCYKQLNGTKKVRIHMDNHRLQFREVARRRAGPSPASAEVEPGTKDEAPATETQAGRSPGEWPAPGPSPTKSPSKLTDTEQEAEDNKYTCRQCRRTFMSLRGLRTHEHSHAAVAAIKKLNVSTTAPDSSYTRYMSYKTGHTRPFVCTVCSYRTTVMGLWWSHFLKKHQDVILSSPRDDDGEGSAERSDTEPLDFLRQIHSLDDSNEELNVATSSLYLEPPDVRRQLNHYSVMAQRGGGAGVNVLPEDCLLHCEMCSFTTEHSSSIRRHYLNRHGKKILRCKGCEFFTGSRKTLELHMEMGHSTYQSKPTYQRDVRCPFCLYQTKNKNNMIDHIVLHREERVVPIEVRRPKLSRYLRGVVFRCHKCTFTCSSGESLQLHVARHDDVRPYKCRLCFFDCSQLSDLEEHLSDKHQVLRNHELVGQVSLDELDARVGRTIAKEDEHLSNSERCSNHSEDVEMEEFLTDCSDVPQAGNQSEGLHRSEEGPREKPRFESHTTEGEKHEQEPVKQTRGDQERGQSVETQKASEDSDRLKTKSRDQPDLEGNGDQASDESAAKNSPTPTKKKEMRKLFVKEIKRRMLGIQANAEDDAQGSSLERQEGSDPRRTGDESIAEVQDTDTHSSDHQSSVAAVQNHKLPALAKIPDAQENSAHAQKSSLAVPPSVSPKQPELSREDGEGVSFLPCRRDQERSRRDSEDVLDTSREMPVLENEYLKDEMHRHRSRGGEGGGSQSEDEQEEGADVSSEGGAKSDADQDLPNVFEATDERRFTCELCGRSLVSSSELKRHTMRHGM